MCISGPHFPRVIRIFRPAFHTTCLLYTARLARPVTAVEKMGLPDRLPA
jgi:hypothetical protein